MIYVSAVHSPVGFELTNGLMCGPRKSFWWASKAGSPLGSARAWSELGNRGLMNNVLNIGLQTRKKAGMTSSLLVCLSLVPQKGVSVPQEHPGVGHLYNSCPFLGTGWCPSNLSSR